MSGTSRPTRAVGVPATDAGWRQLLDVVRGGESRVIVEEDGRAVAALIPMADLGGLTEREEARRQLFVGIREMQQAFADVPLDVIDREVARAIEEVRQEDRDAAQAAASA